MARILIIDDDDDVRTMLSLTLTQFGHSVIEARDGKEGLQRFAETNPDLVITDIVMPEKEGLEVLMELRKKQPAPKVIAISGGGRQSTSDYLRAAKYMGASRVLEKPFSQEALFEAINDLLAGAAPRKADDAVSAE